MKQKKIMTGKKCLLCNYCKNNFQNICLGNWREMEYHKTKFCLSYFPISMCISQEFDNIVYIVYTMFSKYDMNWHIQSL